MTNAARVFILKCFCGSVTAVETAFLINKFKLNDKPVEAADIRKLWNSERESNAVLRQLEEQFGERPVKGFPQCEHTRLAEQLVTV